MGREVGGVDRARGGDEGGTGHARSAFNVCSHEAAAEQGAQRGRGREAEKEKGETLKEDAELSPSCPRGS